MLRKTLLLAAALALLAGPALASGVFTGFPAATAAGQPSTGAPTTGGGPITAGGCIPMDTGNAQGINPATLCVSPSQLANYDGGVQLSYATAFIGNVPLASVGNNNTPVTGSIYAAQINIASAFTITNVACLNGSAAATDNLLFGVYNASGVLVANTLLAGTVAANPNTYQSIALTAPYAAAPGVYFVAYQASGATTRFRTITANGAGTFTGSQTGVFGTLAKLNPVPTSFVVNIGPICYVN